MLKITDPSAGRTDKGSPVKMPSLPIKEARLSVDYRGLLLAALAKHGASASAYRVHDSGAIDFYTNRNGWERLCGSLEELRTVD